MTDTRIELIVTGDQAAETAQRISEALPEGAQIVERAVEAPPSLEHLLQNAVAASADLPDRIAAWFASVEMAPALIVGLCIILFLAAFGLERFAGRLLSPRMTSPTDASDVARGVRWFFKHAIMLFIFLATCRVLIAGSFPAGSEAMQLARVVLEGVMLMRVWHLIFSFLTAPGTPERRPTGLTDTEAALIMRAATIMLLFNGILLIARGFLLAVSDAGESAYLAAIITRLIAAFALVAFFLVVRKPVGKLIRLGFARDPANPGQVVALVARFWPAIYIGFLILQIHAEISGLLSGAFDDGAAAIKRSFGALIIAPFLVAGLGLWRAHYAATVRPELRGRIEGLFSLAEGALIVGTGIFIMYAWNIDPFATDLTGARRILPGLVSAAIITVIGISLWRVASALLDDGKGDKGEDDGEVPDGEGGVGGSRLETVVPVLRAVAAAFIGTVTVLLALSSLGVQIAPLLAGAGILGLAIGFGAQKVVEDVISGVLYLVEDAFRKGEYIETSQGKGVVEAIMLRSVRLRHHLGPVFTIPFSAMGTIQNHSRDWVTVKLKFEVGPDQDLEKVRKLVKKVGQQLLEDPELEGQFLAPLKSQGAVALVGSNYQIGVKFTSEPGKQFLIRRKALNAIQHAFRENGIEMAAPRVIVDSPDQAVAAAAKVARDAQAGQATATSDTR